MKKILCRGMFSLLALLAANQTWAIITVGGMEQAPFSTKVGTSTDDINVVAGGSLLIDSGSVTPITNNITPTGNGTSSGGNGAVHFTSTNELTGTIDLGGNHVRFNVDDSLTGTLSGTLKNGASISNVGKGKLLITADVTGFAGIFNAFNGWLQLGDATHGFQFAAGAQLQSSGTLDVYVVNNPTTCTGAITEIGTINKFGNQTLTLNSTTSTFTGTMNVKEGTLQLTSRRALSTGKITIDSGATLEVGTANFTNNITHMTGTGSNGNGVLQFTVDSTCSADIDVAGASRVTIDSGKTVTFSGSLSGDGAFAPRYGTTILTGANTHTGSLDINEGGTLILGDGTVNPTVNASGINDNAHLIWDVAPETSVTFNNTIYGNGTFVKRGTGTLVLGGNIVPQLEVQEGTFSLKDGTLSKGLTTAAGTTFSLDGTVGADSTLAGTWVADDGDTLQMTDGALTFDDAIQLSLPVDNLNSGESIPLFFLEDTATTNAASIDWMAALVTPEMQRLWVVDYDPTARMLLANVNIAPIPEPSTLWLLLLGMAFVVRKSRP